MVEWLDLIAQFIDPRVAAINFIGGYLILYIFSYLTSWWRESKSEERMILGMLVGFAYWFFVFTPIYSWIAFWLTRTHYELSSNLYYLLLGTSFVAAIYSVVLARRLFRFRDTLGEQISTIVDALSEKSFPLYDLFIILATLLLSSSMCPSREAAYAWTSFFGLVTAGCFFFWAMPTLIAWPILPDRYKRNITGFFVVNPLLRYKSWIRSGLGLDGRQAFSQLLKEGLKSTKMRIWVFFIVVAIVDAQLLPLFSPRVVISPEEFWQGMVTYVVRFDESEPITGYAFLRRTYVISRPMLGVFSTDRVVLPSPWNYTANIEQINSVEAKIVPLNGNLEISYPRGSLEGKPFNVTVGYMSNIIVRGFSISKLEKSAVHENQTKLETDIFVLHNNTPLILRARDMGHFFLVTIPPRGKVLRILFDGAEGKPHATEDSPLVKAYRVQADGRLFITFGDLYPSQRMNVTLQYTVR